MPDATTRPADKRSPIATTEALAGIHAKWVTLRSIPGPTIISDVNLHPELNTWPGHALTQETFKRLMSTAKPINAADESVRLWAYAPWYSGTFMAGGEMYHFCLFLGGRGELAVSGGKRGLFSFSVPPATQPSTR